MRVLMLTPDEGFLDRRIAQEAATLATHLGWMVDIHSTVDPGLRYDAPLAAGVRLVVGTLPPVRSVGRGRATLRRLRQAVDRSLPAVAHAVEAVRYWRADRAGAIAAANLEQLLGGDSYDMVFAHDVPVFPLARELAAAWRSPLVCDLHEIFPEQDEYFTSRTAKEYWRGVEAGGLRAADAIIAVNDAVRDYVRERHAPAAPIEVLHNAVPFVPRAQLGGASLRSVYRIVDGTRIMLFAGSLRPHKNLEVLIDGFADAHLDGWVLAVLGAGPIQGALERQVADRSLGDRVFLGARATERDLISMAASADVGLLPYNGFGFNNQISTPNKLFEYMQARLPIASSRLAMIERILAVERNGAYVDFSSPGSTAAGLRSFVDTELPGISSERLDAAAARFSWEAEEPRLLTLVRGLSQPRPERVPGPKGLDTGRPDRGTSAATPRG
jgi:glycosyltransferase involved in cell wall biosynthesis